MKINSLLNKKLKNIKLIISDVDGVLTDGKIRLIGKKEEAKAFSVKDGPVIPLARSAGISTVLITGRKAPATVRRAKEFNTPLFFKTDFTNESLLIFLQKKFNVKQENILYIGDGFNDLFMIRAVGVSASPKNATLEVRNTVDLISSCNGGEGVLEDVVRLTMNAQGTWQATLKKFYNKNESCPDPKN